MTGINTKLKKKLTAGSVLLRETQQSYRIFMVYFCTVLMFEGPINKTE